MSISKSLSNNDIVNFLADNGLKVNLFTYEDLSKFDNLEQLLKPHNHTVILYQTRMNYGHWCCLWKIGNIIQFFDSYGYCPDDELDFNIPEYVRKNTGEDYPHLTWLLYDYAEKNPNVKVYYNEYQLQQKSPEIATCGRHVICRLLADKANVKEYKEYIDLLCDSTELNPDEVVTKLTADA